MDVLKENPFKFNKCDPVIACVGNNGGTDDITIMEGFKTAVDILFENIKNGGTEDELIYPLVYCCRHSIELSLKIIVRNIEKIEEIKQIKIDSSLRKKILHSHSIENLSTLLQSISKEADSRISDSYSQISPLLNDYFFDLNGDAFKYTSGAGGVEILKINSIASISVTILKEKFHVLMEHLSNLIVDSRNYVEEYSLGVFTKHLARPDIEAIAAKLPHYDKWKDESFDMVRNNLRKKYGISSKELSQAIDLIKQHQSIGARIGFEHILGNITDEELKLYAIFIDEVNRSSKNGESLPVFSEEELHFIQEQHRKYNELTRNISTGTMQYLAAFSYVGKQAKFYSEKFDIVLKQYVDDPEVIRSWLLVKISNARFVLRGMDICGQITYEEQLRNYLKN